MQTTIPIAGNIVVITDRKKFWSIECKYMKSAMEVKSRILRVENLEAIILIVNIVVRDILMKIVAYY